MTSRIGRLASACLVAVLGACGGEPPPSADNAAATGVTGIRYLAAGSGGDDGFARALEPRTFAFPDDHLAHPAFRTEWWYFTGNVFDTRDRHFGFELTLFRIALSATAPSRESALAAHEIWMGHLTVTDTARDRFAAAERLSRGAPDLAGAIRSPGGEVVIALEDWSIRIDGDEARLVAAGDDYGIDLRLSGLDRIVPQGDRGLDAKGPEPGNASHYFSAPRLQVSGQIAAVGARHAVTGTAWMDREWSTSALSGELVGWDWFALQLDDGRDLMFYRLRERDGGTSPFSGGSISSATGALRPLAAEDVRLTALRTWTSPATGVRYPVAWELAIPSLDLELALRPRIDAQELDLTVRYWEGAVTVRGYAGARPVAGVGYLELAGY